MFIKISQSLQKNTSVGVSFNKVAGLKETPTQVFSYEICKIFKNTFFTEHLRWLLLNKPRNGSLRGKGVFWSFSRSLSWLSNIMLNLLSKISLDISLLFKLNYRVKLWAVNKPCYNDSLCLY